VKRPLLAVFTAASLVFSTSGCQIIQKVAPVNNLTANDVIDLAGEAFVAIKDLSQELTPENEYYVGRSVAVNILARHDYRYLDKEAVVRGRLEGLTEYVNTVGILLAAQAMDPPCRATPDAKECEDKLRDDDRPPPLIGWHFVVLESDEINAFAAPGGYVFVTRGALKAAKSEDELAVILAHEIAHIVRAHGLKAIETARTAGVSAKLLKKAAKLDEGELGKLLTMFEGSIEDIISTLFEKGYSRSAEYEADALAVELAASVGYDPAAMTRFLTTLEKAGGGGKGGFQATHPSPADRMSELASVKTSAKPIPESRQVRFEKAVAGL